MAFIIKSLFLKQILNSKILTNLLFRQTAAFTTTPVTPPQPNELEDKVALVTGGASGIGLSIVKEFLRNGIDAVTVVDIDVQTAQENLKDVCQQYGNDKVLFVEADVADAKQMDGAFKSTLSQYDSINIVVNNAGVLNDASWERQMKTNLSGNVIGSLLGLQYMSKSSSGDGGAIINVASIMSVIPSSGFPLHTMTQFGIVGFTKALGAANHFDRTGVKLLALCPGLTNTKLLTNATANAINDNFVNEFMEETDGCDPQQPENVAKGLVGVLNKATSGSVWIVENNAEAYEVNFPGVEHVREQKIKM